jgi:sugar diacid utilization regulator
VKGEVDEPRKETILGRQVPPKYTRLLQERGIFRQLLASEDVVRMEAVPEARLTPRVAISVRAAGELLGSIWVAETGRPLVGDYGAVLREAAQTAALHIMRHRMELQAESNLRTSMVRDLLEGTAADVAAVRLGLDPQASYAVMAFEAAAGPSVNRLLPVVDLYVSTFRRAALCVDVGPRVYVVLSGEVLTPVEVRRFAADGARRATGATQAQVYAAVGRIVASVDRVAASRHDADRVMRVLLRAGSDRTVADLDEVGAAANLLEVLDLVRERPHLQEGPLRVLRDHAGDRHPALVATLRAYLDHFGDINAAAASTQVHPNTFRYRLRRACETAGVDLGDPMERLMLWLQLRLLG